MNEGVVIVPGWVLAQVGNRDVLSVRFREMPLGLGRVETWWVRRDGEGEWIELTAPAPRAGAWHPA